MDLKDGERNKEELRIPEAFPVSWERWAGIEVGSGLGFQRGASPDGIREPQTKQLRWL